MRFAPKLTPEQWAEARRLRTEGASFAALARQFDVHAATIAGRARKEGWPSLAEPAPPPPATARSALTHRTGSVRNASSAAALVRRSLVPRLFNVIDIQLKLTELRMQHNLRAAETAVANATGTDPVPSLDQGEKDLRHVGAIIKTIEQVTEIAPALARHINAGGLSTTAAAGASEADAFRREVAQRIEKLVPPA